MRQVETRSLLCFRGRRSEETPRKEAPPLESAVCGRLDETRGRGVWVRLRMGAEKKKRGGVCDSGEPKLVGIGKGRREIDIDCMAREM